MRRFTVVVLIGALGLGLLACGGDDSGDEEARADLKDALGFLGTEYGLDTSQVSCVAREIEGDLGADHLDGLTADLRSVDDGSITIDDLDPEQARVLTDALAACAALP